MTRRKFNAHVKRAVAARGGWKCADCGTLLDETYELDHVVALHLGGPDTIENLAALHAECHRKKTLREEIARLERIAQSKRVCTLACGRCEHIVSPYFVHKCCVTPRESRPARMSGMGGGSSTHSDDDDDDGAARRFRGGCST